jgi:methyl-accepting chemotaxis protein
MKTLTSWYNNVKLQAKLMTAFLAILLLTMVVGLISLNTTAALNDSVDTMFATEVAKGDLALAVQNTALDMNTFDQRYLLEYKTLGFAEARNTLVSHVEQQVAEIHAMLDQLRELTHDDAGLALLNDAARATTEYDTYFMETVALMEQRGFKDEGLEGEFRAKVRSIEAAITEMQHDGLTVDMLTIRRHEKDYLLRGEAQYVEQVAQAIAELKQDAELAAPQSAAEINALADEYLALFNEVVGLDTMVSERTAQYREAVASLQPLLEEVHDTTEAQEASGLATMREAADAGMLTIKTTAGAAIVAGLLISFLLARSIAGPIARITQIVQAMAQGSLDESSDRSGNDEIGRLSTAMRTMQDNLRTIIKSEIQQLIELAGAGNLKNRIDVASKAGFYRDLAVSINELLAVNEQFLNDTATVVSALAEGDLETTVERRYQGSFAKVQGDIQRMRENFVQVIGRDVRKIVQAAVRGDLSGGIDLDDKAGFYRDLSSGINDLVRTNAAIINDCLSVTGGLAEGRFDAQFKGQYQGSFAQLQEYVEKLRGNLRQAIEHDIQNIVTAAANGDLKQRIDTADKRGFYLKLSASINDLVNTSDRVITDTSRVVSGLARGDLTQTITNDYKGTFNQLKADINKTVEELTSTVHNIQNAASGVDTGAGEIAGGNANLSQRTEEQAASLEETSAAMEELTTTVQQTAENAATATRLSEDSMKIAAQGGKIIDESIQSMKLIESSSKQITEIVSVIDEIAFQTNLLALNAAVEAARAGDQGKGFAVVADEVRTLAGRCSTAAKEIKELINNSNQNVRHGSDLAMKSGTALHEIINSVKKVNGIVMEISSACVEQSTGLNEISTSMAQMDSTTQQNAALVEEAAAASDSLSSQAKELNALVGFFRTNDRQDSTQHKAGAKVLPLRSRVM